MPIVYRKPLHIINNQGWVIMYIVGHPKKFDKVSKKTIEAFERVEKSLSLNVVHTHHRHGKYGLCLLVFHFVGVKWGLETCVTLWTHNGRTSLKVQCVVQFINSIFSYLSYIFFVSWLCIEAFAAVHPELWKCYWCLLDDLSNMHPYLSQIFDCKHSVFASCTLNPSTLEVWQPITIMTISTWGQVYALSLQLGTLITPRAATLFSRTWSWLLSSLQKLSSSFHLHSLSVPMSLFMKVCSHYSHYFFLLAYSF